MRKLIASALVAGLFLCAGGALAADAPRRDIAARRLNRFNAYAGPSTWGPWTQIAAHGGPVTYTITAKPVGSTVIVGRVKYFGRDGKQHIETFRGSTTITTGNSWATVRVSFKGIPTGSAVEGTISP